MLLLVLLVLEVLLGVVGGLNVLVAVLLLEVLLQHDADDGEDGGGAEDGGHDLGGFADFTHVCMCVRL